jgi:hypothetical protein
MVNSLALLASTLAAFAISEAPASERTQRCTAAVAEPAEISAIQADYESWRGRCVRLRGMAFENRLYAGREALLDNIGIFDAASARSIVVYPTDRDSRRRPARMVEIAGVIFSCADQHAIMESMREPDTISWVSGYCHTSLANYVRPVSIRRTTRAPVLRLTEAEVAPERRPLVEAPPQLANRAAHVGAAREILAALATGDEQAFIRLTRPNGADETGRLGRTPPAWFARETRRLRSTFRSRSLRRIPQMLVRIARRQERTFVARSELDATGPDRRPPGRYITCWCKAGECSGRWPVLAVDADNAAERPYFCAHTSEYLLYRRGEVVQADVVIENRGLAEPDWDDEGAARPPGRAPGGSSGDGRR